MLGKPKRQRHWGIPMEFIACNDSFEPPRRATGRYSSPATAWLQRTKPARRLPMHAI